MNRLALILLLLVFSSNSADAQNINGVTGTVSNGSTLVISGSGFGTKTTAAPWIFERFESGTPYDLDITSSSGDIDPQLSTEYAYCGTHSLNTQNGLPDGTSVLGRNGFARYNFPHTLTEGENVFISFKQRWSWGLRRCDGPSHATVDFQIKNWRIASLDYFLGSPNIINYDYSDCGDYSTDWDPRSSIQHNDSDGSAVLTDWWEYPGGVEPLVEGAWHTWEIQVKQSTTVTYGWEVWLARNGERHLVSDNFSPLFRAGDTGFTHVLIGDWIDSFAGYLSSYWDDLYVDNSWARVMLGDASTIDACGVLEVQTPTAWSANSVSVSANTGLFTSGQTVYLFVYDSSGVSSNGFPVTIAGTSTSTGITPPSNLRIDNR